MTSRDPAEDQRIAAVVREHFTAHERSQEPAVMQTTDNVHERNVQTRTLPKLSDLTREQILALSDDELHAIFLDERYDRRVPTNMFQSYRAQDMRPAEYLAKLHRQHDDLFPHRHLPGECDVRLNLDAFCLTDLRDGETAEEMRDSFVAAIEHASREATAAWLAERSRNRTATEGPAELAPEAEPARALPRQRPRAIKLARRVGIVLAWLLLIAAAVTVCIVAQVGIMLGTHALASDGIAPLAAAGVSAICSIACGLGALTVLGKVADKLTEIEP